MNESPGGTKKMPLHQKILLGMFVGATAGILSNIFAGDSELLGKIVDNVANPVGQVFLRMLFMVVVPLVFTSISLGVAGLGDSNKLGRIGAKTIGIFLITTGLAATIGLILANIVRPGDALDEAVRTALMAEYAPQASEKTATLANNGFGIHTFVNIIPRNPIDAAAKGEMLSLIFFSLIFGLALSRIPRSASEPVIRVLEGIAGAVEVMIGFAMKLAPIGVTGLIFAVTARFGFEILGSLLLYVLMVLGGLFLHQVLVITTLAKVAVGVGPGEFLRKTRVQMITAFSTSSSNATLPTTIRTAQEEFGVPKEIAGFVLPLGATMNMNGTALFEGLTVLFLAQVFGVDLSLGSQIVVVIMCILTAIGTAGVPGGSIPLLAMVLEMVGVPGTGIALILGVDRILDMSRTVPNVTGDLLTSLIVARSEGAKLRIGPESEQPEPAAEPEHAYAETSAR